MRPSSGILYSTEIKSCATRKLGLLIEEKRGAGELAKGTRGQIIAGPGRGKKNGRVKITPPISGPTLEQQGIDKNLAKLARKDAAMSEEKFEADLKKAIAIATAAVDGNKEIIKAVRAEQNKGK